MRNVELMKKLTLVKLLLTGHWAWFEDHWSQGVLFIVWNILSDMLGV